MVGLGTLCGTAVTRGHLRCVRTSTSLYYRVPQKPTECVTVIGSRGCIRKSSLIETENKHTIDSIAHGLSMITHSRKAVDEDGPLCFVLFFLLYFIITIKTDSFIHYLFARNNIQLRLYICCTPDPQQSLRLFIGPVATSHLREQFLPRVQRA